MILTEVLGPEPVTANSGGSVVQFVFGRESYTDKFVELNKGYEG